MQRYSLSPSYVICHCGRESQELLSWKWKSQDFLTQLVSSATGCRSLLTCLTAVKTDIQDGEIHKCWWSQNTNFCALELLQTDAALYSYQSTFCLFFPSSFLQVTTSLDLIELEQEEPRFPLCATQLYMWEQHPVPEEPSLPNSRKHRFALSRAAPQGSPVSSTKTSAPLETHQKEERETEGRREG